MWASTVRSLRTSRLAIAVFVIPWAIKRSSSLALGGLSKAVLAGIAVEQRGNHLRVERGASAGDSADGAEEVRDVQHPVLQEVAEPT